MIGSVCLLFWCLYIKLTESGKTPPARNSHMFVFSEKAKRQKESEHLK